MKSKKYPSASFEKNKEHWHFHHRFRVISVPKITHQNRLAKAHEGFGGLQTTHCGVCCEDKTHRLASLFRGVFGNPKQCPIRHKKLEYQKFVCYQAICINQYQPGQIMTLHQFEKTVRVLDREMSYLLPPFKAKIHRHRGCKIWDAVCVRMTVVLRF